jgi:hypothetical protein
MVRPSHPSRWTLVALVASTTAIAAAGGGGGASAADSSPFTMGPEVKVSGPSALVGCSFGGSPDFSAAYDDTEVEAQVAVDPTNPMEVVGVS